MHARILRLIDVSPNIQQWFARYHQTSDANDGVGTPRIGHQCESLRLIAVHAAVRGTLLLPGA